jgi:hypothetical protein
LPPCDALWQEASPPCVCGDSPSSSGPHAAAPS